MLYFERKSFTALCIEEVSSFVKLILKQHFSDFFIFEILSCASFNFFSSKTKSYALYCLHKLYKFLKLILIKIPFLLPYIIKGLFFYLFSEKYK